MPALRRASIRGRAAQLLLEPRQQRLGGGLKPHGLSSLGLGLAQALDDAVVVRRASGFGVGRQGPMERRDALRRPLHLARVQPAVVGQFAEQGAVFEALHADHIVQRRTRAADADASIGHAYDREHRLVEARREGPVDFQLRLAQAPPRLQRRKVGERVAQGALELVGVVAAQEEVRHVGVDTFQRARFAGGRAAFQGGDGRGLNWVQRYVRRHDGLDRMRAAAGSA